MAPFTVMLMAGTIAFESLILGEAASEKIGYAPNREYQIQYTIFSPDSRGSEAVMLNTDILAEFGKTNWFGRLGERSDGDSLEWMTAANLSEATASAKSVLWQDVKTHAQGDLTGYLATHFYQEYSNFWNKLVRAYREHIERETMPRVVNSLKGIGAEPLAEDILLDLIRIGVHATYKKRFHRVPDFFQDLFIVYRSGHLPCGWTGTLDSWPEGQLLIY